MAQTELRDEGTITLDIDLFNVAQESASFADFHEKTASARMVLFVNSQVLGKLIDGGSEQCDLHFRGTGIAVLTPEPADDGRFVVFC